VSGTTAFDAKDGLISLLEGASFPSSTPDIWYGYQGQNLEMPREVVWVGEIEWDDESPESLGNFKRDETYRILVTIEVHRPGDTQREANTRAKELLQTLEGLLRQANPLGIANPISVGIVPQLLGEGQDAEGRGAILVSSVRVVARK
jgi:hypothetical protein